MSVTTGHRWKFETAQAAAERFMALWGETCEQAIIVGSTRRKALMDPARRGGVSDIEYLALPLYDTKSMAAVPAQLAMFGEETGGSAAKVKRVSRLDKRLEELAMQEVIFKDRPGNTGKGVWGEKQKRFWIKAQHNDGIGYIQVEVFTCTPPAEWGSLSVIRTGPADFANMLMVYINEKTNLQQHDGRLIVRATGRGVPTPTEESYFKVMGLPHVEPHKRTVDWVNKWRRMRRAPVVYQPPSSTALSGNGFQIGETIRDKARGNQPQAGEQSKAPASNETTLQVEADMPLAERIEGALGKLPGAHPTTLIPRLGCDPVSFRQALRELMGTGRVKANHYGGLFLIEKTTPGPSEGGLPGRDPDGEFDEANEKIMFVPGPEIPWPRGTWGIDLSEPRGRGARLRILPKTRVVNIKLLAGDWRSNSAYVYIGRAHQPKKLTGSPLGNPFAIGRDGTRDQVIAKYRAWIAGQPHLLQMIPYLAGRAEALVCWCAPEACHGDVLLEYIERYRRGEWSPPSRKGALGYNDNEVRAEIRARLEQRSGINNIAACKGQEFA